MKVCNCILGGTKACKYCGNNFEYNNRDYADTLKRDNTDFDSGADGATKPGNYIDYCGTNAANNSGGSY